MPIRRFGVSQQRRVLCFRALTQQIDVPGSARKLSRPTPSAAATDSHACRDDAASQYRQNSKIRTISVGILPGKSFPARPKAECLFPHDRAGKNLETLFLQVIGLTITGHNYCRHQRRDGHIIAPSRGAIGCQSEPRTDQGVCRKD